MKALTLLLFACLPVLAFAQEEEGHMHGPDGRHVAVASTFGATSGKSILSHHDLRVEGPDGKSVVGADVHSIIHRRGNPQDVIHREHNAYEPENEVYGSHMMYKQPGEYTIVENVTLPDKRKLTVSFDVWVPAPAGAEEEHAHGPNWLLIIGGPLLGLLLLYGAYRAGRKSAAAAASVLLILGSLPVIAQEEEGHMHGPDGRHVAVASTFGSASVPLKAFPTADLKESATKAVDDIKFTLSIENEELETDPNVVQLEAEVAKSIGLKTEPVAALRGGGGLTTTGQVRPNPNGAVTVNARVSGRVVSVGVTPGDQARSGQSIALIDSSELAQLQAEYRRGLAGQAEARANLERERANVSAAEVRLANAQVVLRRQQQLARAGAFASAPVEEARSRVNEAEGELKEARSALQNMEATAERMRRGLESGVVSRREAEAANAAAEQARIRVSTAQTQLELAQLALTRETQINTQGLRNAREVQQAEAEVRIARAAVQTARSELAAAKAGQVRAATATQSAAVQIRQLGATPGGGSRIQAITPIGGEVESRPVNVGQQVSEGEVLATLLNTDSVWIESDVFERELQRIRTGQEVSIVAEALPNRTIGGRIAYIGAEVNPETRSVKVRTVVHQRQELLKPNMFVRVVIAFGSGSDLTVPTAAIQDDSGTPVVFVESELGSYVRTVVQLGSGLGDRTIISSGLKAGDKVVTQGAYQLLAKAKGG